ncbi:hypothetical protein ACFL3G_13690 [Planctomycetota bacterium]
MGKPKERVVTGPRPLPMVGYEETMYFADLRLGEFRDIKNIDNIVRFNSSQGQQMCTQLGVVSCPSCRMSVILSKRFEDETLQCMRCLSKIEPLCGE